MTAANDDVPFAFALVEHRRAQLHLLEAAQVRARIAGDHEKAARLLGRAIEIAAEIEQMVRL